MSENHAQQGVNKRCTSTDEVSTATRQTHAGLGRPEDEDDGSLASDGVAGVADAFSRCVGVVGMAVRRSGWRLGDSSSQPKHPQETRGWVTRLVGRQNGPREGEVVGVQLEPRAS